MVFVFFGYACIESEIVDSLDRLDLKFPIRRLLIAPSSQTTMEATVSAPWIWEMSKHSDGGGVRRGERRMSCRLSWIAF